MNIELEASGFCPKRRGDGSDSAKYLNPVASKQQTRISSPGVRLDCEVRLV